MINNVIAKMNSIQVEITNKSIKPQIELISSKIALSLLHPSAFEIVLEILKTILLSNKEIIIGSARNTITIIASMPHEFFTSDKLAITVLNDSFTVEPTIGIKLLIANLAVFIDTLSVD